MRWEAIFIGFVGLSAAASGAERAINQFTNYYYYGDIREIFTGYLDQNGKPVKHGRWRDWDDNGFLRHEIWYRDGKPEGTNITYYPNGQKQHEGFVVNGRYHGLMTTWNRDGEIVAQGTRKFDRFWAGTFVVETLSSEDYQYKVAEFRDGERVRREPRVVIDEGKKWRRSPGPPDYRRYLRWHRYSYEIDSPYPYVNELPPLSKIPELLKWIDSDEDAGRGISFTQLVALSRADFGDPLRERYGGMPPEAVAYDRAQRNAAWKNWWNKVGRRLESRIERHGRRNADAWKLVTEKEPLPDVAVTIPNRWAFRTTFSTGDYDGVVTETVTLTRKRDEASLVRAIRRGTRAPLVWEQWEGLTIKEADDFAFAVAYAIDHPWFLNPEIVGTNWLEGREFGLYYGGFRYELSDDEGHVWWNDSPRHWWGVDYPMNSLKLGDELGSVGLLLWRCFPEGETGRIKSRWRPIAPTNKNVALVVRDDLSLRGEILEILDFPQRLHDALAALERFGTQDDLPAIRKFKRELPARFGNVNQFLEQDATGHFERDQVERLLKLANEATAAIEQRDPSPTGHQWRVGTLIAVLLVGLLFSCWRRTKRAGN